MQRTRTVIKLACAAIVLSGVAVAGAQTQPPPKPVNIAGKWAMTLEMSMGTATPALELKQDGEKITGTYTGRYGTSALEGTLKGLALEFSVTVNAEGQEATLEFRGEVAQDAQSMKGTAVLSGLGDASWSAKRVPDKAANATDAR